MKANEPKLSSAMQLLTLVWEHVQEETSHSWLKVNHAMSGALSLAIQSGLSFDLNDFEAMSKFRPGYWRYIENCYRSAVLYRHPSAWKAIEAYLKRKPFIVKGATTHAHTGDGPCGGGLSRLIVGADFKWDGNRVSVTSFNDDKGYVVACCDGRQYKITHADIKAQKRSVLKKAA